MQRGRFSLTVLRNSTWGIIAQFLIKVLSFIFSIIVIRHLGANDFGQYAAVLAFVTTFAIFSDLGLASYMVREVARLRNAPENHQHIEVLYSNVMTLRLVLSAFTILLVGTAAWLTGRTPLMIGAIILNAAGLLLYAIQGTSESFLFGFERFDLTSGAKILQQFIFVLAGAAALYLGLGYYGLIAANLLGVFFLAYFCWRGVRSLQILPGSIWVGIWPTLIRASLPFGIIGFALGLSYKFDSVLLNIFRSNSETGYYNAAYNLVFSAVVFSNAFNTALYPSLTRVVYEATHELSNIAEHSLRYLLIVSLPIAVGGSVLAGPIVRFLYGSDYLPVIPVLQIIIWTVPLMYLSEFLGYIVVVTDREKYVARAVSVSTCVNIAMNLILVPRYGFMAAAVVTVITEAILVSQHLWTLRALLPQIKWSNCFLRPVLAVTIMGGFVLAVRSYLPWSFSIISGALVYLVGLLLLGIIGKAEYQLVRRFLASPRKGDIH